MVFAAALNVVALSDIIILGWDFLLVNLLNAWMEVSSDKSGTSSRWTALVEAHLNRQI
jgi:hypothetical protein